MILLLPLALQKVIARYQMSVAAIFLRHDYNGRMEFSSLDNEDFFDDYFLSIQDICGQEK